MSKKSDAKIAYAKPWLSYQDQLAQLKARDLTVTDDEKALDYLQRIGYYRLSGYWFAFRERSEPCCAWPSKKQIAEGKTARVLRIALDSFKAGATFQNAVELYVFDKKLRLLVLDALERIEVAFRVEISHTLGELGAFSYLEPGYLFEGFAEKVNQHKGITDHQLWLQKQASLITRSKEDFIRHNREKYGLPLPIWVACEVWDFGTLSTLFGGMREEEQDIISAKYGIKDGRVLASWLRSLNYLRNVCAHHSRLWNRNIVDQPKKPDEGDVPLFELAWEADQKHTLARVFVLLCITQHLLCKVNPTSTWWQRLKELLADFPDLSHIGLNLDSMGIIEGWEEWVWPQRPNGRQ